MGAEQAGKTAQRYGPFCSVASEHKVRSFERKHDQVLDRQPNTKKKSDKRQERNGRF